MGKLIYEREREDDFEPKKIILDVDEDLTISQFKNMCKRLASAIGYHCDSIEYEFGNETDTIDEMTNQAHVRELINLKYDG